MAGEIPKSSPEEKCQRLTPSTTANLLDYVDVFLFDCDGVIWKGDALIDGVLDTLDMLRAKTIKEALNRLPREIVDTRNQRLMRAMDLSMKHQYLPDDLQIFVYSNHKRVSAGCSGWTEHFIVKINEGQSKRIRCMAHKCNAICDESVVKLIAHR